MNYQSTWDVIIGGAGIGGACAAIALAKQGAKVLVLEASEFPRHKVCGEFLSPESKAVFKRLQVLETLQAAGAHAVQKARVCVGNAQMETALPAPALALSRWRLDEILVEAARSAGAEVLCNTRVRRVERQSENFAVETTNGSFHARSVLGASGRQSSWLPSGEQPSNPTRYVGMKTHFRNVHLEADVVELHAWRGGYCGLVQIEENLTNVCLLARYDNLQQRAPETFFAALLQEMPALQARLQGAEPVMPWLATGNIRFRQTTPLRGDTLCCGDSAGFIHPLTGDGMAMAARSGELAAAALNPFMRGDINFEDAQEMYQRAWQREFAARLRWATFLQRTLLDPQFAAPVLSLMARVPHLSQMAVAKTRGKP